MPAAIGLAIVGTSGAAATFVGAMVTGAMVGGVKAAITGENIFGGMIKGGAIGGLTSGASIALGEATSVGAETLGETAAVGGSVADAAVTGIDAIDMAYDTQMAGAGVGAMNIAKEMNVPQALLTSGKEAVKEGPKSLFGEIKDFAKSASGKEAIGAGIKAFAGGQAADEAADREEKRFQDTQYTSLRRGTTKAEEKVEAIKNVGKEPAKKVEEYKGLTRSELSERLTANLFKPSTALWRSEAPA